MANYTMGSLLSGAGRVARSQLEQENAVLAQRQQLLDIQELNRREQFRQQAQQPTIDYVQQLSQQWGLPQGQPQDVMYGNGLREVPADPVAQLTQQWGLPAAGTQPAQPVAPGAVPQADDNPKIKKALAQYQQTKKAISKFYNRYADRGGVESLSPRMKDEYFREEALLLQSLRKQKQYISELYKGMEQGPLLAAAGTQPAQPVAPGAVPQKQGNQWRVPPEQQAARDQGRRSILQQELASEENALRFASTPQDQAIHQRNIAALQRELGGVAAPQTAQPMASVPRMSFNEQAAVGAQPPMRYEMPPTVYDPQQVTPYLQQAQANRAYMQQLSLAAAKTGNIGVAQQYAAQVQAVTMDMLKMSGEQGAAEVSRYGDPTRLVAVWREFTGVDLKVQPRSDGKFDLYAAGKLISGRDGVSREELVDYAKQDIDKTYVQRKLELNQKIAEKQLELTAELEKIKAKEVYGGIRDINTERAKQNGVTRKPQMVMSSDGSGDMYYYDGNKLYFVTQGQSVETPAGIMPGAPIAAPVNLPR